MDMQGKKSEIDLEKLRSEIRELKWGTQLYRVLKEELSKIDHWKQQGRGDPVKAYNARRKSEK
jgi:protein associated with RNAse G/E